MISMQADDGVVVEVVQFQGSHCATDGSVQLGTEIVEAAAAILELCPREAIEVVEAADMVDLALRLGRHLDFVGEGQIDLVAVNRAKELRQR